ncbi:DUF922 domain-containing Zn-dependent protease [Thiorhodococcus mannitoliphagus]|uniref:DUF922 domain-containing Zn-dependent protease n=1 Tax=Thiorhodococcus mannitoliphagus TaxID=329406 RepID=A0A6P1DRF2_9GAMM|nr:DUF922 domain-containing protein [Thiorhodococcus mannitoliphagus]NEX20827.1 DUF922 domain-containing Zn-dependent protease [Thiorhodococcus mannitoliphagus]
MAITVAPNPRTLQWRNFREVPSLPDEDAHIDIDFSVPNRPFRSVNGRFRMAETFQIGVAPVATVRRGASQTSALLAHEQGHYDIGILVAHAMARDFMALEADSVGELSTAIRDCFNRHRQTLMRPVQQKYDLDTNHSQNAVQQQRWDGLIRRCMGSTPTCDRLDNLQL